MMISIDAIVIIQPLLIVQLSAALVSVPAGKED